MKEKKQSADKADKDFTEKCLVQLMQEIIYQDFSTAPVKQQA